MTPRVLDGRYQIDAPLGRGGQGHVFRGRDLVTQRPVALKLMDQGTKNDPELVARFVQEGRLAARIRDPHLVAALHFGVADGQHYIAYDYIPGVVPLTTLLEDGRMEPDRVCDIALQLLDTLQTLHAAGVVHQDISPANCLWCLRPSGRIEVFLIDLGSASSPITGGLRAAREPVGASYFMAPEMARDGGVCDHRVDLWSVGAIMFTLLTGCFVDLGTEDEPLEPPPPAIIIPKIPQAVSDVVMGALTSVERRYPSAAAMMAAIQGLELPSLPRPLPPRPVGAPAWARLGGLALSATVAVLGTLGVERYLEKSLPVEALTLAPTDVRPPPIHAAPPRRPDASPLPPASTAASSAESSKSASAENPPTQATAPGLVMKSTAVDELPSSKKPRRVSWGMVQRAIKQKADELDPCFSDVYVSIGVHVQQGHVTLTSVNGKAASLNLPHHQCVHDVVARLRFANSAVIDGVVGVPLAGDRTRTG